MSEAKHPTRTTQLYQLRDASDQQLKSDGRFKPVSGAGTSNGLEAGCWGRPSAHSLGLLPRDVDCTRQRRPFPQFHWQFNDSAHHDPVMTRLKRHKAIQTQEAGTLEPWCGDPPDFQLTFKRNKQIRKPTHQTNKQMLQGWKCSSVGSMHETWV